MSVSFAICDDNTTHKVPKGGAHTVALANSRYWFLWILIPIDWLQKAVASLDTVPSLL